MGIALCPQLSWFVGAYTLAGRAHWSRPDTWMNTGLFSFSEATNSGKK